jgi:N-acyl-D-glucosamine 2-epimerase
MPPDVLHAYASRIENDLRHNILPFWIDRVVDQERGGFRGALTNDLREDRDAERGALLTSRILWTFSAAYRKFGDAACLAMADHAFADLFHRFHDSEHGGFYWSVAPRGRVLQPRKQTYGQAFALYALSEYHRATGRPEPLQRAIEIFRLIETRARERVHGGYLEATARDWSPIDDMRLSAVDLNEPKSQNTHLHVMEAYTNLLRVWPDDSLRRAQAELLEIMLGRIVNPETAHLGLFFANDWSPRSSTVSYGHDIEAAWLLGEAADVLADPALQSRARSLAVRIADVTLAAGVDTDGGLFNSGDASGVTDTNKEWWPQAEAVLGFLHAYSISQDERHLAAALHTWDFIEHRLIDRTHGEWLRGVTRHGAVLAGELKVGFWKCPYHNGRMGLLAPAHLRRLASPV